MKRWLLVNSLDRHRTQFSGVNSDASVIRAIFGRRANPDPFRNETAVFALERPPQYPCLPFDVII
jgi:hypothetical protein